MDRYQGRVSVCRIPQAPAAGFSRDSDRPEYLFDHKGAIVAEAVSGEAGLEDETHLLIAFFMKAVNSFCHLSALFFQDEYRRHENANKDDE